MLSLYIQENTLNFIICTTEVHSYVNSLSFFLILVNTVYIIGICGIIFNRRNFLLSMLYIEVMYTGIFMHFLLSSLLLNSPIGQVYALAILVCAACESAIGLGILLILFKFTNSIALHTLVELKG